MEKKTEMNYAFTWLSNEEDKAKLRAGLEKLTGNDYEQAERAELTAGNTAPLLTLSKAFQSRLAAKALGVPAPEIKNMPIKAYNALTQEVFTFLYNGSDEWESAKRIGE